MAAACWRHTSPAHPTMFNARRHATRSVICALTALPLGLGAQAGEDSVTGRRRLQPLPAIGSSPETGLQLGATLLGVHESPPFMRARPTALVASVLRSTRGQMRASAEGEHWTADNRWRWHGLLAWQRFPMPYHGIGDRTTSDSGMQYASRSMEVVFTAQRRVRGAWYATAGARWMQQRIRNGADVRTLVATPEPLGTDGGTIVETTVGMQHDSRDGLFAPMSGGLTQLSVTTSAPGASFDYERLRMDTRRYIPLGRGQVLALHALLLGTSPGAPFDQLALAGGADMLRGYARGRFREEWLMAGQLEYRSPIRKRVGAVVFTGLGAVGRDMPALHRALPLPTVGAGLRYQLDAVQRTAIRVDYGRGRSGASGLYIGFNQAF